jgi:hypothetical protein
VLSKKKTKNKNGVNRIPVSYFVRIK